MPDNLNVLFLAAEADPFIKVGGLGDVAGSLPRALRGLSSEVTGGGTVDVRLVLPKHKAIRADSFGLRPLSIFRLTRSSGDVPVQVFETSLEGMPVYFLDGDPISASGSVYSSDARLDAEKYTFFSLAALELARQLNWDAHIVHANDWHTALAAYALLLGRWEGKYSSLSSVLSVHNLPFMGSDVAELLEAYGLPLAQTGLPEWARGLPLPLGLWAANAIVPVSPTYAQEILTPEFGCGLQDYIHARGQALNGILNGLDVDSFNPSADPALGANYGADSLEKRKVNKTALQVRLGLSQDPDIPMFGVVSRMDSQKGIDLIPAALRRLKEVPWQAVILGTGDPKLEGSLKRLQKSLPDRVRAEFKYDAGLARQIYAGTDMFLMPSRYEPCGLSQMIAMRYGCIPIVHAVGGLKDTVHSEVGFSFTRPSAAYLAKAIRAALQKFADQAAWAKMQRAGMSIDFSWGNSARLYYALYKRIVAAR